MRIIEVLHGDKLAGTITENDDGSIVYDPPSTEELTIRPKAVGADPIDFLAAGFTNGWVTTRLKTNTTSGSIRGEPGVFEHR